MFSFHLLTFKQKSLLTPFKPQNIKFIKVVRALLLGHPKGAFAKTLAGDTPLHSSCLGNAPLQVIQTMFAANPDCITLTNNKGQLPIHAALCSSSIPLSVINFLIGEHKGTLALPDATGAYPIHVAVQQGVSFAIVQRV